MSQQPNIEETNYKLQPLSDLRVPRSQGKKDSNSSLKQPYEEAF